MVQPVSLDTILSSLFYFLPKWTPALRRNASRDLLRLLVCKLYGASKGNLFQARITASQDALAASVGVSREWTNQLIARLKKEGWIEARAIRLPDGRFLPCFFQPGRQLKRLLCVLLRYKNPRRPRRVNGSSQYLPSKVDKEKSLSFLRALRETLLRKKQGGTPDFSFFRSLRS